MDRMCFHFLKEAEHSFKWLMQVINPKQAQWLLIAVFCM